MSSESSIKDDERGWGSCEETLKTQGMFSLDCQISSHEIRFISCWWPRWFIHHIYSLESFLRTWRFMGLCLHKYMWTDSGTDPAGTLAFSWPKLLLTSHRTDSEILLGSLLEPFEIDSVKIPFLKQGVMTNLCPFSDKDPGGLLLLPEKGDLADTDISEVLAVMSTLLSVAAREVTDAALFPLPLAFRRQGRAVVAPSPLALIYSMIVTLPTTVTHEHRGFPACLCF